MARRRNISSGSAFEAAIGYSRAVRVGDTLYISGTTGYDYATGSCSDDPTEQLRQIVRNWQAPLAEAGATMADIVQITTYVSATEVFEAITPTLREIFGPIGATNTALVVGFPIPGIKVEISAIAAIGCGA